MLMLFEKSMVIYERFCAEEFFNKRYKFLNCTVKAFNSLKNIFLWCYDADYTLCFYTNINFTNPKHMLSWKRGEKFKNTTETLYSFLIKLLN